MKIVSIKALNINSLKGKTEINFEELTKNGSLFAITGPTGSGKSTILDIISCALYARTARLKNPNDLMSRHCGEAYCEVEFEIKGKRYRSSWSQKRARKKRDGNFQTAKMELVDLDEDKILSLKSREVPKKVEELSGLDFGRFTQSMMLAQGGFDAFLRADEKERSALLEKITGTRIYADISIAVFDKYRNLKEEIDSDLKVLESIELLGEEIIKEKEEKLQENIELKKKTDEELKKLSIELNWIEKLKELSLESKKSEEEFIKATKLKEEHKYSFEKLSLANRALNISPIFTSYKQLKESIIADKTNLSKLDKEIENLDEKIKEHSEKYASLKRELENESRVFELQKQKLKEAHEIQTQEKQSEKNLQEIEKSLDTKIKNLIKLTKSLDSIIEKYKQVKEQIQIKNSYLNSNAKDKKLLLTLGVLEEKIKYYDEEKTAHLKSEKELEIIESSLLQTQNRYDVLKEEVKRLSKLFEEKNLQYQELEKSSFNDEKTEETIQNSLQEIQKLLVKVDSYNLSIKKREVEIAQDKKNREQESYYIQSQKALQEHIEEMKKHIQTLREKKEREQLLKKYEEDRKNLVLGEACFLCGSTNHPYTNKMDKIYIDKTEEMIKTQLQKLETKEDELKEIVSHLIAMQIKIQTAEVELKKLDKEIQLLQSDENRENLKEKEKSLKKELQELKLRRIKKDKLLKEKDKVREDLQKKEKSLNKLNIDMQKDISQKEQFSTTIKSQNLKIKKYKDEIENYFKDFDLGNQDIKSQYKKLVNRKKLYSKNLEDLRVLESEINSLELDKKESQTKKFGLELDIKTDNENLKELKKDIKKLEESRIKILNIANLDTYEKELILNYQNIQKREQDLKDKLSKLTIKSEERNNYKRDLDKKILEDEKSLDQLIFKLKELYAKNSFKDEEDFKNAIMNKDEMDKLSSICKNIEEKYAHTKTIYLQTTEKLNKHQKESLNIREREELKTLQSLLEQKVNAITESIGSDKKELEINKQNSDKHKEKIVLLDKKKEAFKVWVKLNELIGSADGTKFKKFAQGITLQQLINLANQHLNILSNRYTLTRNEDKLLDLEIIDAYQGNVIRSVNTLSGGESFIVSLSLALGLSELASQKIAIDSLFLDEGFGSLDEDSLEIALNALNLLQNRGKMVGIISHVKALKERIPLEIKLVPNGDGSSFVQK